MEVYVLMEVESHSAVCGVFDNYKAMYEYVKSDWCCDDNDVPDGVDITTAEGISECLEMWGFAICPYTINEGGL